MFSLISPELSYCSNSSFFPFICHKQKAIIQLISNSFIFVHFVCSKVDSTYILMRPFVEIM